MADDFNFEANIDIDVTDAYKSVDRLADKLTDLNEITGGTDKSFDRAEKGAARFQKSMQDIEKNSRQIAIGLSNTRNQANKLAQEYRKLAQAKGKAFAGKALGGNTFGAIKQGVDDNLKYEQDFAKLQAQERAAGEKRASDAAREGARERQQIAENERTRELRGLRESIQQRHAVIQQGEQKFARTWDQAHAENRRRDQQAAQQRLAQAKKNAADIARVWDTAQKQNQLRTGVGQLEGGSLRQNLNNDVLGNLRNTQEYADLLDRSMTGLANQRYAMYDVATSVGAVGLALSAAGLAAAKFGADYDKAFASVRRTSLATGDQADSLRSSLVDMTTAVPTNFVDVANIATLGAQMDIATENLDTFTATVSTFAATTDVTVDAAAEGFGRLAQLTGTPQDNIDRLGSSIYLTGINAVATESQILSIAQQIATAGNLAGFSAQEIIGLSSAMASLGVAPEQARGAFQRVFNDITSYAAEGGAELESIAQTAGMSASAFSEAWLNEPQKAFNAYLNGLSDMDKALVNTTLKQQGFYNVRDLNVLTRLANNMDVYSTSLDDAAQGYADNTALAEGAEIEFNNLADSTTMLLNSLKAIATESGFSTVLNEIVQWLTKVSEAIRAVTDTGLGKFVTGSAAALTLLGGGLAAIVAAYFTARASLLALITALRANNQAMGETVLTTRALAIELLRVNAAGSKTSSTLLGLAGAAGTTTTRVQALGRAFRTALISTGVGVAIYAAVEALLFLGSAFEDTESKAESYFNEIGTGFNGDALTQAIQQDTQAFHETGEALRTVELAASEAAPAVASMGDASGAAASGSTSLASGVDASTDAMQRNTLAIGKNVAALTAQTLAQDEDFQSLFKRKDELENLGVDLQEAIRRGLSSETGFQDYLDEVFTGAREGMQALNADAAVLDETLFGQVETYRQLSDTFALYQENINAATTEQQAYAEVMEATGFATDGAVAGIENMGDAASDSSDSMSDLLNSTIGISENFYDMQGALYDLGGSLYENGDAFDAFSEGGRANMSALSSALSAAAAQAGSDSVAMASNVGGIIGSLQESGIAATNELGFLGDMLNTLVGNQWGIDFTSEAARKDIASFIDASIEALRARAELERQTINAQRQSVAAAQAFSGGLSQIGIQLDVPSVDSIDTSALTATENAISGLQSLRNSVDTTAKAFNGGGQNSLSNGFRDAARAARDMGSGGNNAAKGTKNAGDAAGKAADQAKDAAKEFRDLSDYASDLGGVFDTQLDLSFNLGDARDARTGAWTSLADNLDAADEAVKAARKSIREYRDDIKEARLQVQEFNATLRSLRADRTVLQYQLSVATDYGDDLRATEIRAELAENASDIADAENERESATKDVAQSVKNLNDAEKELSQAQKDAQRTLKGSSEAARDNRAAVEDLVRSYADELEAMAEAGASRKQLTRRAEEMRQEFKRQLTQMGFNRKEVKKYADEFRGFTQVIKNVPRNITVKGEASMSSAQRAINRFLKKNRGRSIGFDANVSVPKRTRASGGTWYPNSTRSSGGYGGTYRPSSINSRGTLSAPRIYTSYMQSAEFKAKGTYKGISRASGGSVPNYLASGGISGLHPGAARGSDTVPAWLTPGEWVVQKKAVDHYGSDFISSINSMKYPAYLAAGTSSTSGSTSGAVPVQLVELLPNQLMAISKAVSTQLVVDGKVVANTVDSQNHNSAVRGSN